LAAEAAGEVAAVAAGGGSAAAASGEEEEAALAAGVARQVAGVPAGRINVGAHNRFRSVLISNRTFRAHALSSALGTAIFATLSCSRAPRNAFRGGEVVPMATVPTEHSALDGGADALDGGANVADAMSGLPPIPGEPLFTNLVVPGFPDAVVALPNGATTRRPVLIVLHGSGDRPDWNCDAWRHITSDHGFVLCPRGQYVPLESGKGDDKRYTHRGGAYLRRHVDAALAALATRFADYADIDRPVLAGFSLGATEVSGLALADPSRFPRVAELEGGQTAWTDESARAFANAGGERVLFGCGSSWCTPASKAAAARLEKGGVESRVVQANVGHTTDPLLQEAIMAELGWFLGGDPRWTRP
jgi:predicted esterase